MFFYLSKIITFVIDPLTYILAFGFLGIRSFRNKIIPTFVFALLLLSSIPLLSNQLMYFLEHLKEPNTQNVEYDAVIVLSGMLNLSLSDHDDLEFNGAVDRVLRGIELSKRNNVKYLVLSGGSGALIQKGKSESEFLARFVERFGVDKNKIIVERSSRNTYENAVNTADLLQKKEISKVLLVTSAFHMYRSYGCFKQAGVNPDVLPVDYRSTKGIVDFRAFLPSSSALQTSARVVHELVGILVYGMTGKAKYF